MERIGVLASPAGCEKINRSHAHAQNSRTHDSRTNHSHEHRASNGATRLKSRSRRRRPRRLQGVNRRAVRRETGHTHTPTENNTLDTDTHAHDKNNTPNPQTNTSHKHLTTLEGVNWRAVTGEAWESSAAAAGGGRPRPRMRLILGDRASALRVNPHTLGSALCACVLVCSEYMNRL